MPNSGAKWLIELLNKELTVLNDMVVVANVKCIRYANTGVLRSS